MPSPPLLQLDSTSKRFGNVTALHPLSLELAEGRIYGLAGENGAGKSTFVKLLAGVHRPDAGQMRFCGHPYTPRNPAEAARSGISVFHQEIPVCPNLSVAANVYLGKPPGGRRWLNRAQDEARCRTLLQERVGIGLDPSRRMGDCTVAERQLALLARVMADEARLILLDEPTTALSSAETKQLFKVIRHLAAQGVTFVFISHLLDELLELCEEIYVLRDGALAGHLTREQFDSRALSELIAGRTLESAARSRLVSSDAQPILEAEALSRRDEFENVSFQLRPGEVLGIGGIQGSGRSALARALFAAPPAHSGAIRVGGNSVRLRKSADAMAAGIGYVPEDRNTLGLFDDLDVQNNLGLLQTRALSRGGLLSRAALRDLAMRFARELHIKARAPDAPIMGLSGGNQQKVLIARWLTLKPRVLVMNEPARGVDVGAKDEIYRLIRQLAEKGHAFVVASSDMDELLRSLRPHPGFEPRPAHRRSARREFDKRRVDPRFQYQPTTPLIRNQCQPRRTPYSPPGTPRPATPRPHSMNPNLPILLRRKCRSRQRRLLRCAT